MGSGRSALLLWYDDGIFTTEITEHTENGGPGGTTGPGSLTFFVFSVGSVVKEIVSCR
jgi:hypothetical protein